VTSAASGTPLLLTVEQAAQQLSIGRTLMFALIRDGLVDSVQVGRLRRVTPAALTAFTERLSVQQSVSAA
jgi:excisionase family DNA binding protein